jgi:hypothetical protein
MGESLEHRICDAAYHAGSKGCKAVAAVAKAVTWPVRRFPRTTLLGLAVAGSIAWCSHNGITINYDKPIVKLDRYVWHDPPPYGSHGDGHVGVEAKTAVPGKRLSRVTIYCDGDAWHDRLLDGDEVDMYVSFSLIPNSGCNWELVVQDEDGHKYSKTWGGQAAWKETGYCDVYYVNVSEPPYVRMLNPNAPRADNRPQIHIPEKY